jgi:hypothetical protein
VEKPAIIGMTEGMKSRLVDAMSIVLKQQQRLIEEDLLS